MSLFFYKSKPAFKLLLKLSVSLFLLCCITYAEAQPVTGVWRGRIIRGSGLRQSSAPVEIKLVAQGDSIVGTSYYYGSGKSYIRYSLKGYFDPAYNTVIWQDYHMIENYPVRSKEARQFSETMKTEADYSCPDGKTLRLDGSCKLPGEQEMKIELKKMSNTLFPDEWDDVIDGYFAGLARKDVVDSVWSIASEPYVPKTATALATDDIASTGKPQPNAGAGRTISANPDDVAKVTPVVPVPPNVVEEKKADTLLITQAKVPEPARVVETPPSIPPTRPVVATIATDSLIAGNTGTVLPKPSPQSTATAAPPPAKPPTTAPRPAAPQDITASIAKENQQRRQASGATTRSEGKGASSSSTSSASTVPPTTMVPPGKPAGISPAPSRTTAGGAIIATPDKPVEQPVMLQAFSSRRKVVQAELPIIGDTIELRFYDNAEVDGDSISLFLNGVALFQHVRLDARPYVFKLPVRDLPEASELTMVAENLGSIPPNTAFMEAFVDGKRYSARLESTEVTSAVIRLVKRE